MRRKAPAVVAPAAAPGALDPMRGRPAANDRDFLPAALEITESPASPVKIAMLYAICALVAAGLAWSYFGYLDVQAVAHGKIQAAGRTKVIQPMDSGKVIAVRVENGTHVKEGDILIELDPTAAAADRMTTSEDLDSVRGEIARRRVAVAAARSETIDPESPIRWDSEIPSHVREREQQVLRADLMQLASSVSSLMAQRREKESERDKYAASIAAEKKLLDVLNERVTMRSDLWQKKVDSRAHVLDGLQDLRQAETSLASLEGSLAQADSAIVVLDSQIAKAREDFVTSNTEKLADAEQRARNLAQSLAKATVKLEHMTLKAPISGTVQALSVTTLGQVVSTGQELMQIVPEGQPLEIEAYALNTDIGFLAKDQPAVIKVDSFPFTRYGSIEGTVTHVATDAIPGLQAQQSEKDASRPPTGSLSATTAAQRTQDLVFPVTVVPARSTMNIDGKDVPLSPGMTVSVEIKTERRRVIDYLFSPLVEIGSTAMHER